MRRLAATVLTALSLVLCLPAEASAKAGPALASAHCDCGPADGLSALGYHWMTMRGKGLFVMRMSRRQLKAMTEIRLKNQLFGFADPR
jgi:hypothetical protein